MLERLCKIAVVSCVSIVALAAHAVDVPDGFEGFQFTPPYHTRNPFDAAELVRVQSGFDLFTNEAFEGNGRTCGTCHLPAKNFNVTGADIQAMLPTDRFKILAGTNADLERTEMIDTLALFNIHQGFGAPSVGQVPAPAGPFRASMSIGGLGFTTLNRFVCRGEAALEPTTAFPGCALTLAGTKNGVNKVFDIPVTTRAPHPEEFGLYYNGALLSDPDDYTFTGERQITLVSIAPASTARLVAYFPGSGTAVDDGIRDIMLGWAGDGSLKEMFPYLGAPVPAAADCAEVIEDFAAHLTDLERALVTFSLAAVKTHFPISQDRVPGADFRCPTADELLDMAKFQKWLGRRFELDITKLKKLAPDAETGRRLFSSRTASCVACHVNAGGSDNQGRLKLDPVPFLKFADGSADPDFNPPDPPEEVPLEIIGANKASRSGVRFLEPNLAALLSVTTLPSDPGDEILRGGGGGQGGFSVQSIIEATRKTQFFHNNAVRGGIEDAIAHYFTTPFDNSQGGAAIRNAFRGALLGPQALSQLEALAPRAIDKMGVFLRALSSTYAIADGERMIDEMIFRLDQGLAIDLPSKIGAFALSDAKGVLDGVRIAPNPYGAVAARLATLQVELEQASQQKNRRSLAAVGASLRLTRNSILTTAELPCADGTGNVCDDDFVSTLSNEYAGPTYVSQQHVYKASDSGTSVAPYAGFLPAALGLDAIDVLVDGTVLFSTASGGQATHAGGSITLRHENIYRFDPVTNLITVVVNWAGLGIGIDSLDALDGLDELGQWTYAFSTTTDKLVNHAGGSTLLRKQSLYRFNPATKSITLLFDGTARGLTTLDAADVLLDGKIVVSTATSQSLPGGKYLRQQDAYVFNPVTKTFSLAFDGAAHGLDTLDAFVAAAGRQ